MSTPASDPFLDRLQAAGVIDAEQRSALGARPHTPWWLAILLALAAWIASLIVLGSFFGPLLALADSQFVRGLGGGVLIAAALFLFRRGGAFTDQMGLAFSLAGQTLVGSAMVGRLFDYQGHNAEVVAAVMAAVAVALLLPRSSPLHRAVCALIALSCLAYLIGPGIGLAVFGVLVAATATALWLFRTRWATHRHAAAIKALAHATTVSALVLAPYGHSSSAVELFVSLVASARPAAVPALYAGGAILVLLAAVAWLTRTASPAARIAVLGGATLFALVAHTAPGLVVCATILAAAFHACHRGWIALSLAFGLFYVGEFYYSLHSTLLAKSVALAATGAVLLALRFGLQVWSRRMA